MTNLALDQWKPVDKTLGGGRDKTSPFYCGANGHSRFSHKESSVSSTLTITTSGVEQFGCARLPHKQEVVGSNPTTAPKYNLKELFQGMTSG